MSTTIDNKIVEMRFDNKHFETNVSQTMSTLDKLKQKLNLSGASKGLENISSAASKVNLNGMSNSIQDVSSKFSVMEVVGVTALANLANSAVNAGKRFISALTVDPVMDGWREYEMTLNAVQTTMAGTGKTAEEVEVELKKLDEYADKTVYSTADMLNNLPKFTNAGVELEKATTAMIGIANATALAGGDANKASIAFYNLGQAIGTGYLTRMDYNSINNAGIATMEWKEQMVEAAIAAGTLTKVGDDLYQAGNKQLTLQQLFIDGLQEQWASTEVLMKVFGDYGDETTEIGKKAMSAAKDIKTFTQMMESLKATAGTGWKDTWQIIFGGLDEAKEFWTSLSEFISGIINKMADFRNNLLRGVLSFNPFTSLLDKLKNSGIGKVASSINTISNSLSYYQDMVNKVWRGDYRNQPYRKGLLEDEGHNFSVIQTLVNKGYQYKLTVEDITEAEKKFGVTTKETTKQLESLSDAKLKEIGLTDEEIKMYRQLEEQSKKTGKSIEEIIEAMSNKDGRTLLIESFTNAGKGLVTVFQSIGKAWTEIFEPINSFQLYGAIESLNKFSQSLVVSEETAGKLVRTFKGVFALLDILLTLTTGPLGVALKLFVQFLAALDTNILDFTAILGDYIVAFAEWLNDLLDFTEVFRILAPFVQEIAKNISDWFKNLPETGPIKKLTNAIVNFKNHLIELAKGTKKLKLEDVIIFFKNLGETIKNGLLNINEQFNGVPGDIIMGLANGLKDGASTVIKAIMDLAKSLIHKFQEVLGIESPSKVFFAIGGFIIAGLIGGLLAGSADLKNTFGEIGTKIGEFFSGINWSQVFAAGISTGFLVMINKILNIVDGITAPLRGVEELLSGVGEMLSKTASGVRSLLKNTGKALKQFSKGFKSLLKGIGFEHQAKGIKNLALSILILAGAIALLTLLDTGKMWSAVGAIAVLAVIMGVLAFSMQKISESSMIISKDGIKTSSLTSSLLGLGLALLAMAGVVKLIGGMDIEQAIQGFIGLGILAYAMKYVFEALGSTVRNGNDKNMKAAGKMMRSLSITLLLMVGVVKLISLLEWEEMGKGAAFIAGFIVFVGLLGAVTKNNTQITKLGGSLALLSLSLLLLVGVIALVDSLDSEAILKGIIFAVGFVVFLKALVKATTIYNSQQIAKVGGTLLAISAAMLLLVLVIKLISGIEVEALIKGTVAIAILGLILTGLIGIVKLIGPEAPKIAGTLAAMGLAIGILAGVSILLSLIDLPGLAKGVIAVGVLAAMMSLMLIAARGVNDIAGTIMKMAIAIGIMAAAVIVLSFIDPKKLAPAVLALSILMGMFSLVEREAKNVKKSFGALIVLTAAIAVMAGAIYLVGQLEPERAISSAVGLSILLLAMTGAMRILKKATMSYKKAIQGAVGLLALCVPLAAMAGILILMNFSNNAITNAIGLSGVLLAMSGVMVILSKLNVSLANAAKAAAGLLLLCVPLVAIAGILILMNFSNDAIKNATALSMLLAVMSGALVILALIGTALAPGALIGIGALLLLCVPLVAIAGILILMNNVEDATANVNALSQLLIVMTGVLTVLAIIGPLALIGVAAITALTLVIGAIGLLAVGIGALMEKFPQLQTFLDSGLDVLIKLAGGIGEMVGAFIGGALAQISNSLPTIGSNLSQFMTKSLIFIAGAKTVDEKALNGVKTLVGAILALTAADVLAGIGSFISGSGSFAKLGAELSLFMLAALPFIALSSQIKPEIMTGVKSLAEAVLILTGANIIEGLGRFISGGNSLSEFGSELGGLGTSLSEFLASLQQGGLDENSVKIVGYAADSVKKLAEAADAIPNDGGLAGLFAGENSIDKFGDKLPALGTNLSGFVTNLGTFDEKKVTTVDCAGKAIKALAEAADTIPNEGGLWSAIVGDNSLATFSGYLPDLGTNLAGFITNLGEFDKGKIPTVECACEAIKALAEAAKNIPNEGGFWAKIVGDNSLATFGSKLPGLGTNLSDFVGNLGEFSDKQVSSVYSASAAIKAIAELGNIDIKDTGKGLESFGKKMVAFAKKVKEFVSAIGETTGESIDGSITKVKDLISMAQAVADTSVESLKTFGESLKSFGKNAVKGFVEQFSGTTPKDDAKKAVQAMVQAGIDGAEKKKDDVKKKFKSVAKAAIDALSDKSYITDAKTAGENIAKGFSSGIDAKVESVATAAANMVKAAIQAAKEAADENSPSKEFYKIGDFAGIGFVNALNDSQSTAYSAGYTMADLAKEGLSKAITNISDLINDGIDTQPTIRPVLDLSNVESGAGYLSSMFNNGPSVGVTSNLRAISYGVNSRLQNGVNDDVISAINGLRKDLSNMQRDSYTINGITYDDGSNITDAVKSIVRAVRMERRV